MSILQRTLKLVLATCISITVAYFFGLSAFTTSGTIALLSVMETRKDSYAMAFNRFLSSVLALASATLIFWLLGFSIWTFAAYLALYVPLAYRFKLAGSIAPSTVLVFHVLLEQNISPAFLLNELALLLIGSLVALAVNSFMFSRREDLVTAFDYNIQTNKELFDKLSQTMQTGHGIEEVEEIFTLLEENVEEGKKLAQLEAGNLIFAREQGFIRFFNIRERQNRILRDILNAIHLILDLEQSVNTEENKILAELFEKIVEQASLVTPSQHVEKSIVDEIDADIEHYTKRFKEQVLPSTWEEFEIRSNVFVIFYALGLFSQLNLEFYNSLYTEDGIYADLG